jgi:hypothetical protein
MRTSPILPSLSLAAIVAFAGAGCTTRSQVFEGYSQDQLWTAMVATARSPAYDDWKISDNEVYIDEDARRIEIFRVLKRTLVSPYSEPRRESEEWKFQIVLARDEELGQPLVDFTARQVDVPAHVWDEADRYFMQMRTLLGPVKSPSSEPASAAEPTPMPPPLEEDAKGTEPKQTEPQPTESATPAAAEQPTAEPAAEPAAEPLPERR